MPIDARSHSIDGQVAPESELKACDRDTPQRAQPGRRNSPSPRWGAQRSQTPQPALPRPLLTFAPLLYALCSGDFDAKFFRKPLTDFLRQPVMHPSRPLLGGVEHGYWRRRCHRHSQPDQCRKREPGQRCNLQQQRVSRPKISNDSERQQEDSRRNRSQHDEPNVDDAVNLLPAAAMFAGCKVILVVAAHLRCQAGNIVSPARQNLAHDWINALLTHEGVKISHRKPDYRRIGCNASVWDANNRRLQNKPPRDANALSASLRAISG